MGEPVVTFFIGGTYSADRESVVEIFGLDENYKSDGIGERHAYPWAGGNTHDERLMGGLELFPSLAACVKFDDIKTINIIGFSHGGTVGMLGLNHFLWPRHGVDSRAYTKQYRLFTIAMPALTRYEHIATQLNDWNNVKWYNIYSPRDSVQGTWAGIRVKDDFVNKGRAYFKEDRDGYRNFLVDDPKKGRRTIHRSLPTNPDVIKIIERAVVNG